jgi:hypothetical protein
MWKFLSACQGVHELLAYGLVRKCCACHMRHLNSCSQAYGVWEIWSVVSLCGEKRR